MHKKPLILFVLFGACCLSAAAHGQGQESNGMSAVRPDEAADLLSVYRMAAKSDPQVMEARSLLDAEIAARRMATAPLLPHIAAEAGTRYNDVEIEGFGEDFDLPPLPAVPGGSLFSEIEETYWTQSYSVSLTQSIIDGEAWSNMSAAESRVQASKEEVRAAELALILQTVEAYFGVLSARAELETAAGQEDLLGEILQRAQARLDAGTGDVISLHEARARYDAAESSAIAARNRVEIARQELIRLTGRPVGVLRDIADLAPRRPVPAEVGPWLETARANRPALMRAGRHYQAALHKVEATRRARWPDLNLTAGYGYREGELLPSTEVRRAWVGLKLTIPIYQGGRIPAGADEARAKAAAVRYREAALLDEVNVNVETAFANLETSVAKLRASREAVDSAATSYDATRKGYEVGTRTIVDVLTAAQNLEEAKRTYDDALYGHVLSRVRLKWAAGILSPLDVASINELLVE